MVPWVWQYPLNEGGGRLSVLVVVLVLVLLVVLFAVFVRSLTCFLRSWQMEINVLYVSS